LPEWGKGEALYLQFDVTADKDGGSGLELSIFRELTKLHGGQISVSSVAGKGSTLAFYIKS
jgi:signal transduction histidine kinase